MHTQQGLLRSGPARDEASRFPSSPKARARNITAAARRRSHARFTPDLAARRAIYSSRVSVQILNVTPLLLPCRNSLSTGGDGRGPPCDALQLNIKF
jgi:hypothetical protein